ncbi:hypothetical protein [Nonomuraea longicatena]|uniref:Uncharacterized protein n=1 Tax=Nonomuraea longicatena TaxID=83682 RepID=A0ABN1PDH0_9ACTN
MARDLDKPRQLHKTDWMALLSGLLFLVLGILLLTDSITDPAVLAALVVLGLGFSGLVAVVARITRGK